LEESEGAGEGDDEARVSVEIPLNELGSKVEGIGEYLVMEKLTLYYGRNLGIREGRGSIINVASMYGLIASPVDIPATPYTSSKHGELSLPKRKSIS